MATKHRNKAWKVHERNSARKFGSERTLVGEGRGKRIAEDFKTHSDSLHDNLYLECKYKKEQHIYRTFYKDWEKYVEDKHPSSRREWPVEHRRKKDPVIPILEIRIEGQRGTLIVVKDYDLQLLKPGLVNAAVSYIVRKKFAVATLYDDTAEKAAIESKIPCLSLKEHKQRGALLVFNPSHLNLIKAWNKHPD